MINIFYKFLKMAHFHTKMHVFSAQPFLKFYFLFIFQQKILKITYPMQKKLLFIII
jgi:hypothetical protein